MPCDWRDYPADWRKIALAAKEAAGWKCQECGRPCRKPGEDLLTFMLRIDDLLESMGRRPCDYSHHYADMEQHPQRWTLTCHHPNHDTLNPDAEIICLCAPCHLRADADHHTAQRRRSQAERRGQIALEVA